MDTCTSLQGPSALQGPLRPEFLRDETLYEIFQATAARLPEKIALAELGGGAAISYRALQIRAERVAAELVRRGVGAGDFVGLWMHRSIDLHVGMLGILAAGAAFVPIDADSPADRAASALADCGAALLLTHTDMGEVTAKAGIETLDIADLLSTPETGPLPRARPDDPAYVIYTSGTTGKPKGIVVSHRNICHYLRAGNAVLGIVEYDVVLQQASLAFDLALEEIFVPYSVGATLKIASAATLRATDRLADVLEANGVTVIDTVPTLLALLERDVATARLLIVGGEACPPRLVERFSRPGRRIINSYGPTEATVVATACELVPGEPITIGRPIPNTTAYVVDDTLALVEQGTIGELLIGGPGVVAGYTGLPGLSAAKFIANPFAQGAVLDPVLYRTGDAVGLDPEGRLVFHGRIDDQVKIRGFRIELGEIETALVSEPGVTAAAVVAHELPLAGLALAAHIVPAPDFDVEQVRRSLARRLPSYMIPQLWQMHTELPRLSSGKVDRKALAVIEPAGPIAASGQEVPTTPTEAHLLEVARAALGTSAIGLDQDFFTDLGGHSLTAATFVSEVRKVARLSSFALQDVYEARTLRRMAQLLDAKSGSATGTVADLSFAAPPLLRRVLCGLAQAIALPFIIAIVTVQWIGLLLSSIYLVRDDTPLWIEIPFLCGIYVALNLGAKLFVIVLKWLVIGRTRPGVYPLWGSYYFRLWLVQRTVHLTMHKFLQGTPLMRIYLRALGAKIGTDAMIHEFEEGAVDLISIGPRASIGQKVRFANAEVIGNEIHVGRIEIAADAVVGNACVIGHDVVVGQGAELADLTALAPGTRIGSGERWDGAPGRKIGGVAAGVLPPHPELGSIARALQTMGYFVAYNLIMMVGLLPIFPAFYILSELDGMVFGERDKVVPWDWVFLFAWPSALILIFVSMLVVIIMRWVLLPRLEPGRYSIFSGLYFRKWAVGLAVETMLETLNSLYATLFMRNWYRLMGTRIGRGTEISANFSGRYDLIELGESNFIGDEAIFGDEDVRGGWMTLERIKTGDRCFFGNLSVVAKGAVLENDALIGVKSKMPVSNHVKAGETWFGSPAMAIPNRQKVVLAEHVTYLPPLRMRLVRLLFEALHTSLPTAVLISLAYVSSDIIEFSIDRGDWPLAITIFLAIGIAVSMLMFLVSVVFKWVFAGRYRATMQPMWSWWAMRAEAVAVLYGGLANKVMLDYVRGTPFLPWLLRLYGMKVGKGTYINCTDVTEFDCIEIGDFAVINMHVNPQTHLYEDRIMKVGHVRIGRGATLGTGSIVLYDARIGEFARTMPLTVVMKGETIPAHSIWEGAPARQASMPDVGSRASEVADRCRHPMAV